MASAPMGNGPPVKMRTVSPGISAWSYEPPAGAWPTSFSVVGSGRHVLGAHGIAVHGREIGGRLGEARFGETASTRPGGVGDRHHLGRQRLEGRDHAGMGVANGEHERSCS